jgi:hypothetical protein
VVLFAVVKVGILIVSSTGGEPAAARCRQAAVSGGCNHGGVIGVCNDKEG